MHKELFPGQDPERDKVVRLAGPSEQSLAALSAQRPARSEASSASIHVLVSANMPSASGTHPIPIAKKFAWEPCCRNKVLLITKLRLSMDCGSIGIRSLTAVM